MAKMSEIAPVTEYQLFQLAGVALAVGRADAVPITHALRWLTRQVEDKQLSSRLFGIPITQHGEVEVWSKDGDFSQWKLIETKADAKRWHGDRMPTIAQSRYLHVDDLTRLAAAADTSNACRAALLELVGRRQLIPRSGSFPESVALAAPATESMLDVVAAAKKSKSSQAAERVAREDDRMRQCESMGMVFDRASVNSLPYGVGAVAKMMGITRQSLSSDVKAALRRRFETARNGKG